MDRPHDTGPAQPPDDGGRARTSGPGASVAPGTRGQAAIYAHRHTVGYRLERIREPTGLDPMLSEDRGGLGLG
ncbi:MAG: helix-turn-helix domain-containing protein [Solirubrobacteraceae bacterium]